MRKCKVHGTALKNGTVPIRYGFPAGPPVGYFEAERSLFPNAKSFMIGGCLVGNNKSSQRVRYCPECREAESAWTSQNETDEFWLP